MKSLGLWAELQALWRAESAVPPDPTDEWVVTDPSQVRLVLGELARQQCPLAVQAAEGGFMGSGVLALDGVPGVRVRLQPGADTGTEGAAGPVNVTASVSRGLVLFTLNPRLAGGSRWMCAPWPDQLLLIQSRRHFRLSGLGGTRSRAWLGRPGSSSRLPLHDLSEEGMGLEAPAGTWPENGPAGPALLHLDDAVIRLPQVQVMHTRTAHSGGSARVGLRMLGLGEEQLRLLRRWLTTAQATQGRRAA